MLRQVVYFTAGVGVVYSPRTGGAGSAAAGGGHSQHFFLNHTDDIKVRVRLGLCLYDCVHVSV